ncbi:MAG: A/G-specific adenine glycosylase [Methylotenera sp.]|jgi:A/G-specific adenine glycosylase|nr:A/G-specific adenine glycosylase [Methylotenera sp.]
MTQPKSLDDFSSQLIAWQKQYGRHDLPWQNTTDPYAIWVSEIMLQQTQVSAVIGYYQKFMVRFPAIASLASATQEEVLQYWSGLGYYSRARNLHHAAQTIMAEHHGQFPQDFETMQTLSGIGRSTAAAIASFAFNQIQTILDGNVKRVLARYFAITGWPSSPKVEKQLWTLAEGLLPKNDMIAYTQGLMDLGATLCTRSKPACTSCPLSNACEAYAQNRVHELPTPKPKKAIPVKQTTMLIVLHGDEVLLQKRPPLGVWGGLWSFPEVENPQNYADALSTLGITAHPEKALPMLSHTFTHFKLQITPLIMHASQQKPHAKEAGTVWIALSDAIAAAIPTPVRTIVNQILTK